MNNDIESLIQDIKKFSVDRDWNKFHNPKNLVMALSVECSELLENFQWLSAEESENLDSDMLTKVQHEVSDVLIYLLLLSDKLDIDVIESAQSKLKYNALKYPISKSYGNNKKYSDL